MFDVLGLLFVCSVLCVVGCVVVCCRLSHVACAWFVGCCLLPFRC